MKIKSNILFYNIISILIIVIALFYKEHFNLITWLVIIETILTIITIKKENSLLSIGTIFILFTLLFHCGQAIIVTFGINDPYYHRSVIAESIGNEFINAELYVLLSIFFWGNGYSWVNRKKNYVLDDNETVEEGSLKHIRKLALIVIAISIVPLIYIDLSKIIALKNDGYLATYEIYKNGIQKYLYLISRFARPAISILMLSYKNDSKKCKLILVLSSIYFSVMMLSGDRGTNIIYMLSNLFLYYRVIIKRLNVKKVIIYAVAGYFFLGFISAISMFRYSEWSIDSFVNVFSLRSSDGIIYSCLREFGSTMRTLVYSIRFIPNYHTYNYGATYLVSLLNVLPKLPTALVNMFNNCFAYTNVFPTEFQNSLGGSFLGELYYNFGWFGTIMTSVVGFCIGKIDSTFTESIHSNNWEKVAIIITFVPNIILWVRDFFSGVLFVGFWMIVIFKIFSKKNNNNQVVKQGENIKV